VSQIHAATPDQVTVRPDEDLDFWDLVCAEDDWLRAEFDAIVTAEDPDRCDHDRLRPPARRRPGPPSRGPRLAPRDHRPRTVDAPVRHPARQRSPPPHGDSTSVDDEEEVMTSPTTR